MPFPASYPSPRYASGLAYDPIDGRTLLFGGAAPTFGAFLNDTWEFVAGNWTPLLASTSCTHATCPLARAFAGFAYDLNDQEAVLFGGIALVNAVTVPLNDTWVFSHGAWSNITSTAGPAPSPRYDLAMTYASSEGYVLLFGGVGPSGYLGDTWSFAQGRWANISSAQILPPGARGGAALADSPTGYTLLYGGQDPTGVIENSAGCPYIMWWFSNGTWTYAKTGTCVPAPPGDHPLTSAIVGGQPCGRYGAALAWSPKNQHFVLYGGIGTPDCSPAGTQSTLNDTYLYLGAPGGYFSYWASDNSSNPPSDRAYMASTSDYRDGFAVIFGGIAGGFAVNETWRYYAVVQASLKGPLDLASSTTALTFPIFTLKAFGGSGDLDYIFNYTGLKTGHLLTGAPNCTTFTDQQGRAVPVTGVVTIRCAPDPGAYNVYQLSATVWDAQAPNHRAYANWTFTAEPPEAIRAYSQFSGAFYSGVNLENTFSVYAEINNGPVSSVLGSLDPSTSLTFVQSSSSPEWWNASFNMGGAPLDAQLQVVASTSNWDENASLSVEEVELPGFLLAFIQSPGVAQSISTSGTGPFATNYTLTQTESISLTSLFNFTLPSSVPFINGVYNLLPSIQVTLTESNLGQVNMTGQLTTSLPAIGLGAFSLTLSGSLTLAGTLAVTSTKGVESVNWVTASMTVTITGDFKANIPIWGYTFSILGNNITIGLSLSVDVAPAIALSMILAPVNTSNTSIANGFDFTITQLIGSLTLPLTIALNFGIAIASVSVSGGVAVAVVFQVSPPPFKATGLWVNGTASIMLQFLFWSTSWTLYSGTWYHTNPSTQTLRPQGSERPIYNNGSGAVWHLDNRTYNSTGYDQLDWTPTESSGIAVGDMYPHAVPTAASAYNGAYLFYSDDRVSQPVTSGLSFSGLHIDASSNTATRVPTPSDPGFLVTAPVASTMPDGSLYVLWDALPTAQAGGASPASVSTLALHGASYSPANGTWGPVTQYTTSGVAESFATDTSASTPIVTVLTAPSIFPGDSTSESLQTFDLHTHSRVSTAPVAGYESVVSVRGGSSSSPSSAVLRLVSGNYTLVGLSDGSMVPMGYSPPANATLVEARQVPGSETAVLLRYREPTSGLVVLYDRARSQALATFYAPADVSDAEALLASGVYQVYVSNTTGLEGWNVTASGTARPEAPVLVQGVRLFGLAQVGSSLLLYAVVPVAPGSTDRSLFVAEVGADLAPIVVGMPSSNPGGGGTSHPASSAPFNATLYLLVPLLAATAVLASIYFLRRRRTPPTPNVPSSPVTAPSPSKE
ncbi:MAG: hypothetical protein L3K23_09005 [Thermoplasmata archaeon]|nr:hypothetical protein [Thermoplasmata archaeon]